MAEQLDFDQAHQTLQEVSEALENGRFVHVRRQLQDMEPEDIAHLLEASPRKSRDVLWQLTDPEDYGEILDELNEDVKDALVSKMAPETLAEATEGMETDDVAYVLRSLPDDVSREVLSQMDSADRALVENALSYPEDSAGALMNTDVITIRGDVDVDVVLRYLRIRGELPAGIEPSLGPVASGLGEIFTYAVRAEYDALTDNGKPYSAEDLRIIQDWIIRPQLVKVAGITEINSIGGFAREYQVAPIPGKLFAYKISVADIVNALKTNNQHSGAGYIERNGEQWLIRSPGQLNNLEEISQLVVARRDDAPVRIKDLAIVKYGKELRTGSA